MKTKDIVFELIRYRRTLENQGVQVNAEVFDSAISALEFKERYDNFWEEVKTAGRRGKEIEIHHSGRVFKIREVTQ